MRAASLVVSLLVPCSAWVSTSSTLSSSRQAIAPSASPQHAQASRAAPRSASTSLNFMNPLVAGSIAGAVGVGVAFPLDTIKTKQQTAVVDHSDIEFNGEGTMIMKVPLRQPTIWESMQVIYRTKGIPGFFGGVRSSMIGQAVIKSVAFGVNSAGLAYLTQADGVNMDSTSALLFAAAFAGFVTAFLATPIDRIKVLMQCNDERRGCSDMDCVKDVLNHEGVQGLLFRGLGPTFFREIPAYTIYFATYGWLQSTVGDIMPASSLLYGAVAGGLCVMPAYPADVVKTIVQNSDGSDDDDIWKIIRDLYETQGMSGFWDGLTPRMLRAAINHAVTFATYEALV